MRLFVCMLNPLVQQPLLCSLSLLFFVIQVRTTFNFFLTLSDLTFLEAIFIAFLH